MTRSTLLVLATMLTLLLSGGASAQVKHYRLEATDGLRLHNVAAEPAVLQGKKGLRVTFSEETVRRFKDMTPEEQAEAQARVGQYAVIEGLEFANGVIEAEIAGAVAPVAQAESIPTDSPRWQLEGKAKATEYLGRRCLWLQGRRASL